MEAQHQHSVALKGRWMSLWKGISAEGDPIPVFQAIYNAYSTGRAYHNMTHVGECLKNLDLVRDKLENPLAVEFALWFHDVVYDTRSQENEQKSAELAVEMAMGAGLSRDFAERVRELILATKHRNAPVDDNDTKYMLDIDLSILGQPPDIFDKYDREIAAEFWWVPRKPFNAERANVLAEFGERKQLFRTQFFSDRYEEKAKSNIKRTVAELRANAAETVAVYAGSFDPPTIGHAWVARKGARIFTKLIIAVAQNSSKTPMFSEEERIAMLKELTKDMPNVTVVGLGNRFTADFAKSVGARYLLRGTRDQSDSLEERRIVLATSMYIEDKATKEEDRLVHMSLSPPPELEIVSSSFVKSMLKLEGWQSVVQKLVPQGVYEALLRKEETRKSGA
jgi:pantetheine-phosphate adenylyltransferase